MEPPQIQALLALESDLQAALEATQSAHDETLLQLDASRRTIHQMLRNEATETALYVDDTQLQMRAIRDVVALEMDRARRDVDAFLTEARRNVTLAREARDRTRAAAHAKLAALQRRRNERASEWQQEIQRVKTAAAREAAQIQAGIEAELGVRHRQDQNKPVETTQRPETTAVATDTAWVWPFVAALLLGATLLIMFLVWHLRRAAAKNRRRRVLYSEQLKSHFATHDHSAKYPKTVASDKPESPRSPASFDRRRPTLQRRLRPSWSPAASTATTVTPPDTPPSSVFTSHDAFASATPF